MSKKVYEQIKEGLEEIKELLRKDQPERKKPMIKQTVLAAMFSLSLMVNAWAETTFNKDQLNFLLEHWFAVVAFFECGAGEQISTDDVDALNLQLRTVLPEGWAQTEDSMAAQAVVMDAMVTDPQTTCNIGLKFLREHIESARQLESS